ncbi:hypothetical protein DPMN_124971 [Dreissena polymorpha]|uniref:Uncharacterized protein n=1 Tax=Dreissena polymorpha TaxID=45954 RepID=A0A9D4H0H9_DREPO|nr:hypothetical protein DPMN_124971 [Dreissena polymorpha]
MERPVSNDAAVLLETALPRYHALLLDRGLVAEYLIVLADLAVLANRVLVERKLWA